MLKTEVTNLHRCRAIPFQNNFILNIFFVVRFSFWFCFCFVHFTWPRAVLISQHNSNEILIWILIVFVVIPHNIELINTVCDKTFCILYPLFIGSGSSSVTGGVTNSIVLIHIFRDFILRSTWNNVQLSKNVIPN